GRFARRRSYFASGWYRDPWTNAGPERRKYQRVQCGQRNAHGATCRINKSPVCYPSEFMEKFRHIQMSSAVAVFMFSNKTFPRWAAASFNKSLDRMTRSAVSRVFQCERPWRAPHHLRSAYDAHG